MGNYMSNEPPETPLNVLHNEVIQLGEEYEVEFDDAEGGSLAFGRCKKNPGHKNMVPLSRFSFEDIPSPWKDPWLHNHIMYISHRVVRINVGYVSHNRPQRYHFSQYRGKPIPTCGSGYLRDIDDVLNQPPIDCPIQGCDKPRPHKVTPIFEVATANHVVYDHVEAETATLTMFYDSDGAETIKGEVLKVMFSSKANDQIELQCVSHDLELFEKFTKHSFLPQPSRPSSHPRDPLVVVVSHPHGYHKHVSFGEWVGCGPDWVSTKILDRTAATGTINHSEFVKYMNKMKISDYIRMAESKNPDFRKTGEYIDDFYLSPELFCKLDREIQANPNITFREYIGEIEQRYSMSFITYSAATCPGSSGSPVHVFFDKEDGPNIDWALRSTHFRHFTKKHRGNKHINASGLVRKGKDYSKEINHYKQSLTKEK